MSIAVAAGAEASPDLVDQQVREVEARLVARYFGQDGFGEQAVRQHVAGVRAGFGGAQVRSFLPILVECGMRVGLVDRSGLVWRPLRLTGLGGEFAISEDLVQALTGAPSGLERAGGSSP